MTKREKKNCNHYENLSKSQYLEKAERLLYLSNVVTEAEEEPWKGCPSRWLQRGRCDALDVNMTKKRGPINAATPKC